ncbi:4Fe-4S dicluster domain-containing protein [Planctomycetota bacterium]
MKIFGIDLSRCTNCGTCVIACCDRADLPDDTALIRVDEELTGEFPELKLRFRMGHCFHCARPPCAKACNFDAIELTPEGPVLIDMEACTGCGGCIQACPFEAVLEGPDGKAAKCDACQDEISEGRDPVCVRACPMRALSFTDKAAGPPAGKQPDPDFDDRGAGSRVNYFA